MNSSNKYNNFILSGLIIFLNESQNENTTRKLSGISYFAAAMIKSTNALTVSNSKEALWYISQVQRERGLPLRHLSSFL